MGDKDNLGSIIQGIFLLTENLARKIVTFGLFAVVVIVTFDVIARDLLGKGIPGTVEMNECLLVVIGFMGIVQTSGVKGHITVDLLYEHLRPGGKRFFDYTANIFVLLFTLLFLCASWNKAVDAYDMGETAWFGSHVLSVWILRWIVPLSCFLLALQVAINILEDVRKSLTARRHPLVIHAGQRK